MVLGTAAATLAELRDRIREADSRRTPLRLLGGGTKDFYGQQLDGEPLSTRKLAGIVSYEPTELVVTVLAGTPLAELEAALAERRQFLAFEPPHFGAGATVGGMIACGLSGPRRASAGAARDFVLGAAMLDHRGELLRFGGQVMKNVAGYDVSRLLCGSLGILGLVVEVSLKVLPVPAQEATLRLSLSGPDALDRFNRWAGQPLPISATRHAGNEAWVRLSGAPAAVEAAVARIGGERVDAGAAASGWAALREHRDPFFDRTATDAPLWRLSVPSASPPLALPGAQLIEWGGALRWLRSDADAAAIRDAAAAAGGTATLFRGGDKRAGAFSPLPDTILRLHRNLKRQFDPNGIFNPGRMYAGL
ncbi:MAG TPA: glycolate oxidase subunit GlcE [Burkholderiaceae bacterium]|nr:glycolate oxidase subunit GlcE [Burkholderiaceae bacterium]